jgi:hypothetical protein
LRKAENNFILSVVDYVISALNKSEEQQEWEFMIKCRAITTERGAVKVECKIDRGSE